MCENLKEVSESLGRIEGALKIMSDSLSEIKDISERAPLDSTVEKLSGLVKDNVGCKTNLSVIKCFLGVLLIVIFAIGGIALYVTLVDDDLSKVEWSLLIGILLAFLLIVIACCLLFKETEKSKIPPVEYYRYSSHIADVIRDLYEIERKETAKETACKDLKDLLETKIITKDDLSEICKSKLSEMSKTITSSIDAVSAKIAAVYETGHDAMSDFILDQFKEFCNSSEISLNISNKKDSGAN